MERSYNSSFMRTDFSRSSLPGWKPPIDVTQEHRALETLKRAWRSQSTASPINEYGSGKPILIVDLDDFEIYRTPSANHQGRSFELIGLHHANAPVPKRLSLDGFLCLGSVKIYVEGLSIECCSIEGYQQNQSSDVTVYVQTRLAKNDANYDIWFRVNKPSQYYTRFHEPFLCVAQLAKHTLDYLEENPRGSVGLNDFKQKFSRWLTDRYTEDLSFREWHAQFQNRTDFRVDVNAYIDFLYQEAYNLPNSKQMLDQPLWGDCMARGLTAVQKQDEVAKHTITTPDVYESFKDMYFGKKLRSMSMSDDVQKLQRRRKRELGFQDDSSVLAGKQPRCQAYGTSPVKIGDVVAFDPDRNDTKAWKNPKGDWLAYVQNTQTLRNGVQRLFVLYLYRPHDTNISIAKYRFKNELFFSDNCNCTEGELLSTYIKGKYNIDWLPQKIDSTTGYFVRQTYMTQESAFVTLKNEHKTCICRKTNTMLPKSYRRGDTVYITKRVGSQDILEPVVIRHIGEANDYVTVRKLLRLDRDCVRLISEASRTREIANNELVLTDDYEQVQASTIQRRCHIRFIPKHRILQEEIPFPYNRRGAGDFWFISMGIVTSKSGPRLVYLSQLPRTFNQGEKSTDLPRAKKLPGLSIFCGGGNFDRGLEEGGAVEFRHAIDLDGRAIHTQRANAKSGSNLQLYFGSVDDYLTLALAGVKHQLIARVGELAFIAAGSPCPGK
jgi:DNA (cytosine-5)-methyltransferase 1